MFQVSTNTRVPVEDPEIVAGPGLLANVNGLWVPRSVPGEHWTVCLGRQELGWAEFP